MRKMQTKRRGAVSGMVDFTRDACIKAWFNPEPYSLALTRSHKLCCFEVKISQCCRHHPEQLKQKDEILVWKIQSGTAAQSHICDDHRSYIFPNTQVLWTKDYNFLPALFNVLNIKPNEEFCDVCKPAHGLWFYLVLIKDITPVGIFLWYQGFCLYWGISVFLFHR